MLTGICIRDRIVATDARLGKSWLNIVLPPGEQNGKIDTALAEVCAVRVLF